MLQENIRYGRNSTIVHNFYDEQVNEENIRLTCHFTL